MGKDKKSDFSGLLALGAGVLGLAIGGIAGMLWKEEEQKQKQKDMVKNQKNVIEYSETHQEVDSLECAICTVQLTEPCIIITCGHTFDKKCIHDWLEKQNQCPLCKQEFKLNDLKPNYTLIQFIQSKSK